VVPRPKARQAIIDAGGLIAYVRKRASVWWRPPKTPDAVESTRVDN
jgi:hypothetical protein